MSRRKRRLPEHRQAKKIIIPATQGHGEAKRFEGRKRISLEKKSCRKLTSLTNSKECRRLGSQSKEKRGYQEAQEKPRCGGHLLRGQEEERG